MAESTLSTKDLAPAGQVQSQGQPTTDLNVERLIQDHAPSAIANLEKEISQLVGQLLVKEAQLARMRLHQRIQQG
jgi:hypothetical protein